VVPQPVGDDTYLFQRMVAIWKHVYYAYPASDWYRCTVPHGVGAAGIPSALRYFRLWDDNYVVPENLNALVGQLDPAEPQVPDLKYPLGTPRVPLEWARLNPAEPQVPPRLPAPCLCSTHARAAEWYPNRRGCCRQCLGANYESFIGGGGGWVCSRAALHLWRHDFDNCAKFKFSPCGRSEWWCEDATISRCLVYVPKPIRSAPAQCLKCDFSGAARVGSVWFASESCRDRSLGIQLKFIPHTFFWNTCVLAQAALKAAAPLVLEQLVFVWFTWLWVAWGLGLGCIAA
jgi:hypothetical protein